MICIYLVPAAFVAGCTYGAMWGAGDDEFTPSEKWWAGLLTGTVWPVAVTYFAVLSYREHRQRKELGR